MSIAIPSLLDAKQVVEATRLPLRTIYRLMGRNQFPKPIKVGVRRVAWLEREIRQHIDEATKARAS